MQHILNIAFDFDDEKVRKIAEKRVTDGMDDIINTIVLDQIAPKRQMSWSNSLERDWNLLYSKIDDAIADLLVEHKEEIIDRASVKLVESLKRTKLWKEKTAAIMEGFHERLSD